MSQEKIHDSSASSMFTLALILIFTFLSLSSSGLGCSLAATRQDLHSKNGKDSADKAASENPTDYESPEMLPNPRAYSHYLRSRLFDLDGKPDPAIREMKTALLYDDRAALHVALGRLYWKKGDDKKALEEAGLAISRDPNYPEAFRLLADCNRDLKEFAKAVKDYETALDLTIRRIENLKNCSCKATPGNGTCAESCQLANSLFFDLGRLHMVLSGFNEAEKVYKRWANFSPERSEPRFQLGRLAEEKKDFDAAEKWYQEALDADPYDSMAFTALASLLERKKEYKKAIELYLDNLQRGGDEVQTKLHIGELYLKLKDNKNSNAYFEDAASSMPGSSNIRFKIGAILYDSGLFEKAEQEFRKGLALTANDYKGRYLLALTLYQIGRFSDALKEVSKIDKSAGDVYIDSVRLQAELLRRSERSREAVELLVPVYEEHKTNVDVASDLAMALFDLGKTDEALKKIERLMSLPSLERDDLRSLSFTYSILLERAGKKAKSLALLKKLLAQSPDDPVALNFLGYTLAERGQDLDKAEELIRKALEKKPESGYIIDSLGWVLFKKGKLERALQTFEEADRKAPRNPEILEHIAACKLAQGKKSEAAKILKKALKFWPEPFVRTRIKSKLKELVH
ncbi:MAG: tetratricopeptide repeat protein [Deltaproteobacteria bacterium]|nr:tetratricopeptide repeat protein [Deltaproteobacteria bacterium]